MVKKADVTVKRSVGEVVEANDPKWGNTFAQGCLVGEPFVSLHIPVDKLNPVKHAEVGLNGEWVYLAKGQTIQVPASIAELWNHSYSKTIEAEESITATTEIQS